MPSSRHTISAVDLAWLRMERPTNPMAVIGVLTLGSRVKYDALYATLTQRLLKFELFRAFPTYDVTGAHWTPAARFSLKAHLHKLALPPRAGQRQLEAAASKLASTPLDPSRPMWQMHLVERYRRGSAVIVRFHHSYADGIALLRVLLTLTDAAPRAAGAPASAPSEPACNVDLGGAQWFGLVPLAGSVLKLAQTATDGAANILSASLHALAHPQETATAAKQIADMGGELAHIATLSEDPPTALKGGLGTHKQLAWAAPLPLADVKTISQVLECTINDVLLATAAGALGSHLRQTGAPIDGIEVRALVPVNLRTPVEEPQLGNRFGLVFAKLPIGEQNPLARLYAVRQDMQALKHSSQPVLSLWLLMAMGLLPSVVEEQAIELFTKKASAVVSNVPGPREALYLAGARVDELHFWVPQAGSIGVGVSLLTYDGKVHFGLMADSRLIAEPRAVVALFATELERLLLCAAELRGLRGDSRKNSTVKTRNGKLVLQRPH